MSVPASLLPELEDALQHGSAEVRAKTLRRVTDLFLQGASHFSDQHVLLFDEVIGYLIEEIEAKALAELSRLLAPVPNAPHRVMTTLAHNDDIDVAGPVLKMARLGEADLKYIAETKSQAHLLAMSERVDLSEVVSDVLAQRGDGQVARSVAANQMARLSESTFTTLVKRAERDSVLAVKVGTRPDIPPRLFRKLLLQASGLVQQRLFAHARPEIQEEIRQVLAKVTEEVAAKVAPLDYTAASGVVQALHRQKQLTEADVVGFAESGKYKETIAALATLTGVPIEVVNRLVNGERSDPLLILARAAGFGWRTVEAIMMARPGTKPSNQALDSAHVNFDRLTEMTAQRVVRFWQVRQGGGE